MARPASSTSDILLYFLALFLPPVPVFLKSGCGADFLINICLSILGWIPGVIHAWWIISRNTRPATSTANNPMKPHRGGMTQAPPPRRY